MNAKLILFSMFTILILLALFTPIFRKSEKKKTSLEISYFEALKNYQKTKQEVEKKNLYEIGLKYFQLLGNSSEKSKELIKLDIGAIN